MQNAPGNSSSRTFSRPNGQIPFAKIRIKPNKYGLNNKISAFVNFLMTVRTCGKCLLY